MVAVNKAEVVADLIRIGSEPRRPVIAKAECTRYLNVEEPRQIAVIKIPNTQIACIEKSWSVSVNRCSIPRKSQGIHLIGADKIRISKTERLRQHISADGVREQ